MNKTIRHGHNKIRKVLAIFFMYLVHARRQQRWNTEK